MGKSAGSNAGALEAMRMMAGWEKESKRKATLRAKALGFSSWEEHERHVKEQDTRYHAEYERRLDEQCARLGKTREQLEMEDPQRYSPNCWKPDCDCDDHPIPFFCPKTLVDYRSQELMPFLRDQNRLRIDDLRVESGDKSRRLDQEVLEGFWVVRSRETSPKLPPWAKADAVLQQITRARWSPTPSAYSTSLRSSTWTPVDIAEDTTMSDLTAAVATSRATETDSDVHHPQVHEKWRTEQILSAPRTPQSRRASTPEKHKLSANAADRTTESKQLRSRKTKFNAISRIQKAAQKAARGTRSHHLTQFFELDKDGVTTKLLGI